MSIINKLNQSQEINIINSQITPTEIAIYQKYLTDKNKQKELTWIFWKEYPLITINSEIDTDIIAEEIINFYTQFHDFEGVYMIYGKI